MPDVVALGAAGALGAVLVLWAIGATRRLRALAGGLRRAFGSAERLFAQRERRAIEIVRIATAAMKHERETLSAVRLAVRAHRAARTVAARRPGEPGTLAAMVDANAALQAAIARLLALTEAYPELKQDARVAQAGAALADLDAQMVAARQSYNEAAAAHNDALRRWPARSIALALNMHAAGLLPEERAKA
jgi:LemA protein